MRFLLAILATTLVSVSVSASAPDNTVSSNSREQWQAKKGWCEIWKLQGRKGARKHREGTHRVLLPWPQVYITSADDHCIILPRDKHTTIGDSEHPGGMKSYCTNKYDDSQGESCWCVRLDGSSDLVAYPLHSRQDNFQRSSGRMEVLTSRRLTNTFSWPVSEKVDGLSHPLFSPRIWSRSSPHRVGCINPGTSTRLVPSGK